MDAAPTITRSAPALPSKDYALLRQAGIEHIRRVAGKVWTDHNLHDPGITMLEALCYAITEIGHRIDQPVADLLFSHPGGTVDWQNLFFPAQVILPNCPLTIKDYRKLLLDIQLTDTDVPQGLRIRDAFLFKSTLAEQKCYVQMKTAGSLPSFPDGLTYDNTPLTSGHYTEQIHLNGLYAVQLEFDPIKTTSGAFVDLNANDAIQAEILIDTDFNPGTPSDTLNFDFQFPYWDLLENFDAWGNPNVSISSILVTSSTHYPFGHKYDYYLECQITFSNGAISNNVPVQVKMTAINSYPQTIEDSLINPIDQFIDNLVEGYILQNFFAANALLYNGFLVFFQEYKFRIGKIWKIVSEAQRKLHAHRNLCEDYFSIKGVRTQQIATCGFIELLPGADPNQVLLDISTAISEFFSPTFKRYNWQELLDEGRTLEQIFEGPLPVYGFIKDEDLDTLQRANAVYTSDLINLIMDVPGVLAVHNFKISNYIDNRAVVTGASDCIQLVSNTLFLPRFDIRRSLDCLKCRKDGVEVPIDKTKIRDDYEARLITGPYLPLSNIVPYPEGESRPLEEYYSIQHDLPLTYGIGLEGLAPSESDFRKAQAKQLKAYLLFFDQLLANFLSQLVQLKDYFSMSDKIDHTYFFQPLYEVPHVSDLLQSFTNQTGTWNTYTADTNNDYMNQLRSGSETDATFFDRRNRFMDHILARFAEDFTGYSIALFDHLGTTNAPPQLITDKIDFLKNLPEISRCRARAFNYRIVEKLATVWDTGNVSGYEKRVCKKLGFKLWDRRNLYWNLMDTFSDNGLAYTFRDGNGSLLLQGQSSVLSTYSAEEILQFGMDVSRYQISLFFGQYRIRLRDPNNMLLANGSQGYPTQAIAAQNRDRIIKTIRLHYTGEGLHVLEHILLRPRYYAAGTPALTDGLLSSFKFRCSALKDPYSFVTTIVFPSGYKRDFSVSGNTGTPIIGMDKMRDVAFRRFAERTAREEMPAHIFPKIFWLDTDTDTVTPQTKFSMNNFERVYKAWLDKFCNPVSSIPDLVQTQQELVEILELGWKETCPPSP